MAVDLTTLIPSLQREVNPPGTVLYNLSTPQWLGYLTDAFWQARLNGLLGQFTETNGTIVPKDVAQPDITPDWQQLIVLYAGFRIALTAFQNMTASYRARAGSVEYETQKSAQVLKAVLDALKARLDLVIESFSTVASQTSVAMFDAVIESSYSIAQRDSWFIRS